MSVCVSSDKKTLLAVSVRNVLKIFNISTGEVVFEYTNKNSEAKETSDDGEAFIAHKFSNIYFAAITENKKLYVWKVADKQLCCTMNIAKRPTCLSFAHKEESVIVGDKSGDVYQCKIENEASLPKLLLGHLSMVLDVCVSPDDKFIMSADRDEKVRVSFYPNAYSIHSYCLGHKRLVSRLHMLPNDRLLSTSADGTLRLWNYTTGEQCGGVASLPEGFIPHELLSEDNNVMVAAECSNELRVYEIVDDVIVSRTSVHLPKEVLSLCYVDNNEVFVLVNGGDKPIVRLRKVEGTYTMVENEKIDVKSHFHINDIKAPSTFTQLIKPLHGKRPNADITPENTINMEGASLAKLSKTTNSENGAIVEE